jgi:hypothetical protein
MPAKLEPLPLKSWLIEGIAKPLSKDYTLWFLQLNQIIQSTVKQVRATSLTGQGGSIAPTSLNVTQAGTYQVTWTVRITQPASTSSSLQVSVGYSDGGIPVTDTGPAVTGNLVTTVASGVFTVVSDAASPVTFSTTYASVGVTPMQYKLTVVCTQVD